MQEGIQMSQIAPKYKCERCKIKSNKMNKKSSVEKEKKLELIRMSLEQKQKQLEKQIEVEKQ